MMTINGIVTGLSRSMSGGRYWLVAGLPLLTIVVLAWSAIGQEASRKATDVKDVRQEKLADEWMASLAAVPTLSWKDVSKNTLTSAHKNEGESISQHEVKCLPNRARLAWYRPYVIGDCRIQWVMLPSREVKTVQLIPDRSMAHLRIDDILVAPDSSAIWVRLGRSIDKNDHWVAKYFRYNLTTDSLEYTDEQLQAMIEEEKGNVQAEVAHPVWAMMGQKLYETQESAGAAKVAYTSEFWARLQDYGPTLINTQTRDKAKYAWTVCPGLRGRGYVFSYDTGEYVCSVPLISDAQGGYLILKHADGPAIYRLASGSGAWKAVIKDRSRVEKHYLAGCGMFIHSEDATNSYLDYVGDEKAKDE